VLASKERIKRRDSELFTSRVRLMVMIVRYIGILLTSLLLTGQALAQASSAAGGDGLDTVQGLTLFEDIETSQSRSGEPNRPTRESRAANSDPEFTLLGTSRIGSSYSAILRHRSGKGVLVRSDAAIEGYSGYTVVDIGEGKLSLRLPSNVPCVVFPEQGVACNGAANIADLQLANGEPLRQNESLASTDAQAESAEEAADPETSNPVNPFEALVGAGRVDANNPAQNDGARGGRFSPRRISPENVPSGMRVVSTPFGDRLVEQ
jgi:hypothetical protein